MIESISVVGSTGSIGIQTLEVAEHLGIRVCALSANRNADLMYEQMKRFRPSLVSLSDSDALHRLLELKGNGYPETEVVSGRSGNVEVASFPGAGMTVAAIVGVAGLEPVLAAISAGHDIALANKETLVAGGSFVTTQAQKNGVKIYPVDSEHSAVWQCLPDDHAGTIRRIFLTASGGPFRGRNTDSLRDVIVEDALTHPTWKMGSKITVDCATLMNKGLEVIEAYWLFGVPGKRIEVIIHPQSVIHSMVEFVDGSVLAQLGFADMKIPIQAALMKKKRVEGIFREFDPVSVSSMTFEKPDLETFRCLDLAYSALETGGSMPAVMNSANEKAVELFLDRKIGFNDIPVLIESTMNEHAKKGIINDISFESVVELDKWARSVTGKVV